MASLPPGTHPPKFDNTLGALLLGGLFSMALWGVACVQTFRFFTQKSNDGPWLKATIAFLWLLDTVDSALNVHVVYHSLVSNYINPTALLLRPHVWSLMIHGATSTILTFFIRTMFIRRFYTLSGGNIPFTVLIMALSTTHLVADLIITVKGFALLFAENDGLSTLIFITYSASLASDLGVTVGLLVVLFRSRAGIQRTNSLIHTLMMYTVNTGLIVSIDAGISILTYGLMPHNFVYFFFYLFLGKLYLISYLAMLNARGDLREKADQLVSTVQFSHLSGAQVRLTGSLFNSTEVRQPGESVNSASAEVEA